MYEERFSGIGRNESDGERVVETALRRDQRLKEKERPSLLPASPQTSESKTIATTV